MNIAVAGTGYVGLSLAVLLSQHNHVTAVDVVPEKVDLINRGLSPIADAEIEDYLANHELDLTATLDGVEAYKQAELVVIATPTNYDSDKNFFDTSFVEQVIELVLEVNPEAVMVVKSTVPGAIPRTLPSATRRASSSSAPSSSARGTRSTTTCTPPASSSACRASRPTRRS